MGISGQGTLALALVKGSGQRQPETMLLLWAEFPETLVSTVHAWEVALEMLGFSILWFSFPTSGQLELGRVP